MPVVTFDPVKDQKNKAKHRISLDRAKDIDIYQQMPDPDYADRWRAIGTIDGNFYLLVYADIKTMSGIHAISLRALRRKELRRFFRQ
jgi:uncharacterized DUF497 family protein